MISSLFCQRTFSLIVVVNQRQHRAELTRIPLLVFFRQIVLLPDGASHEFEDVTVVDGSPINKDLLLDSNETHIFAMTENQVRRVAEQKD
jgi:hypothetical protein